MERVGGVVRARMARVGMVVGEGAGVGGIGGWGRTWWVSVMGRRVGLRAGMLRVL